MGRLLGGWVLVCLLCSSCVEAGCPSGTVLSGDLCVAVTDDADVDASVVGGDAGARTDAAGRLDAAMSLDSAMGRDTSASVDAC
ncbi:MAG: hypothetical protein OHK0013_32250 [Sandaracinaceae bacterium]